MASISPKSAVEFSYRLVGPGFSEARLALGDRWTALTASYLSDALGDLLNALLSLRNGASSARVSWEEEPGEFRWLFARHGEEVALRVLWFEDQLDEAADEIGDERLAGVVQLDALVAAVVSAARAVLREHGEKGYRERWIEHPFPTSTLNALGFETN